MQVDKFLETLGIEIVKERTYRDFNLHLNGQSIGEEVKAALVDMSACLGRYICEVSKDHRRLLEGTQGGKRGAVIHASTVTMLKDVKVVVHNTIKFIVDKAGLTAMFATEEQVQALLALESEFKILRKRLGELEEEMEKRKTS